MSAVKPLFDQINDHRKTWQSLWLKMADGNITEYQEIKKLDVGEFWNFFDKWREKNKQEAERIRQNNQRRK